MAAEATSAAPATIMKSTPRASIRGVRRSANATVSPNRVIPRAQTPMHQMTTRPCASMRETQPEKIPPITAPAGMAAKSSANAIPPSVGPPKDSCAICGNSARGIAKTIAIRSTTKLISSTGWWRR